MQLPQRARRRYTLLSTLALLAATCLLAACGDDDSGSSGVKYFPPGGVSEQMFSNGNGLRLNLENTAVIWLEAAGGHPGDTGTEDGVDELKYHVEQPTDVVLSLDEFDESPTVQVLDELGNELGYVDGNSGDMMVTLSGEHTFRFIHPHAGDASAEPIPLFFRPVPRDDAPAILAQNSNDVATLKAGKDCVRCNLSNLVWDACPGVTLQGVNLSHANFTSASLNCINFTKKSSTPTLLTAVNFENGILAGSTLDGVDLTDANLSGASFNVTVFNNVTATVANFSGSRFASSTFGATQGSGSSARGASFRDASIVATSCFSTYDLRDADFNGASFDSTSSVHGTWFAGANLYGVSFAETRFRYDSAFPNCGKGTSCTTVTVSGLCENCPCNADLSCLELAGTKYCVGNEGDPSLSEPTQCERPVVRPDPAGVMFTGIDLRDVSIGGADLTNSVFASNTLDDTTDFAASELAGADFTAEDLGKDVDLSGAYLSEATDFTGAVLSAAPTSEQGVDLSCDRVAGTGGCSFPQGTDQFKGANLQYTRFNDVSLPEADLEGAVLDHASLVGANLDFASLKGVSLVGATLGAAQGSNSAAKMRGVYMINADLTDADMRTVDFTGAHVYGATTDALFVRTKLDSADFSAAILSGAIFTNASLTGTSFNGAQLANASFEGATLTNANFDDAYLEGADFSTAASVTGISLSNAGVSTNLTSTMCTLTPPGSWTYMEQDGTPYTFSFGVTKLNTDTSVICPNNDFGPCDSADSLCPIMMGPNPPVPACVPSAEYCYENCEDPPCYLDKPDPDTGLCPFISNCS